MNRREFLKGIAALAVSLILPKVSGSGYITLPSVARIHVNSGDEKIEAHHGKSFELTCGDGTKMGRDENGDYIVPDGAARKMREWLRSNTHCPLEISMQYGQCESTEHIIEYPHASRELGLREAIERMWQKAREEAGRPMEYYYAMSPEDYNWLISQTAWGQAVAEVTQDWMAAAEGSYYEIQNKESDT